MARYRKVMVKIWGDSDFLSMTNEGRLSFLFLLTHPHMTSLGAMRGNVEGLARDLGVSMEAFSEPFRLGLAKVSSKHSLIVLPNFLKHNPPESPNVVKSWSLIDDELPDCAMKSEYYQHVKAFMEGLPEAFAKAFREALPEVLSKGMPYPDPDPDPDPDLDRVSIRADSRSPSGDRTRARITASANGPQSSEGTRRDGGVSVDRPDFALCRPCSDSQKAGSVEIPQNQPGASSRVSQPVTGLRTRHETRSVRPRPKGRPTAVARVLHSMGLQPNAATATPKTGQTMEAASAALLDDILALERPGSSARVRTLWTQTIADLAQLPGGLRFIEDRLDEIRSRRDPLLRASKGYESPIDNEPAWLLAQCRKRRKEHAG